MILHSRRSCCFCAVPFCLFESMLAMQCSSKQHKTHEKCSSCPAYCYQRRCYVHYALYALPGSCSSTSNACKPLKVSNKHRHEAREHPAQHPGLKRGSCARRRMLQMLQSLLLLHVYSETGRNGCSRGNCRPRHCLGGDHQPQQRTATTQR